MKAKGFLSFYGVYFQIILTTVGIMTPIVGQDVFAQNWFVSAAIVSGILLLPFIVVGIASFRGSFAKWLRLMVFSVFKVETFAGVGLASLVLFSFLFLYNLFFRNAYVGEQIFLNVFLLNLLFVFFLALVVRGKFQLVQPSALLIKNNGHSAVYLYQDGVLRHIPDHVTSRLLGYSFDDAVTVNDKEFKAYPQRPPIDSISEARFVKTEESREVWVIFGDVRKRIPDETTLEFLQKLKRRSIDVVSEDVLQAWVETKPLTSILDLM